MIVYQKHLLRIAEYWNGEEPTLAGVDLVRCFQRTQPLTGMVCREFYTILLDLTRESEQLMAGIKRDSRYEIRRASMQDRLTYECWDGSDKKAFGEFCDYYDEFAIQKGQPKLNRAWLSLLAGKGKVVLSQVRDESGALVWHLYHLSQTRATLFYSASVFRKLTSSTERNKIGRANRFHHWQDMQHFKAAQLKVYDFGGWYEGNSDADRLRINQFKEEFGGEIVKNYICERAVTVRAELFLRARRLLLGDAI